MKSSLPQNPLWCGRAGSCFKPSFHGMIFCDDRWKEFWTSLDFPSLSVTVTRNDLGNSDKLAWSYQSNLCLKNPSVHSLSLTSMQNISMLSTFPEWPPGYANTVPDLIKMHKITSVVEICSCSTAWSFFPHCNMAAFCPLKALIALICKTYRSNPKIVIQP